MKEGEVRGREERQTGRRHGGTEIERKRGREEKKRLGKGRREVEMLRGRVLEGGRVKESETVRKEEIKVDKRER